MTVRTEGSRPDEEQRVYEWRVARFLAYGCTLAHAERLALSDADTHKAAQMIAEGCDPKLLARILA